MHHKTGLGILYLLCRPISYQHPAVLLVIVSLPPLFQIAQHPRGIIYWNSHFILNVKQLLAKEMFHLTHFILRLYGVRHMVKDHSVRGNPLPPHELLFPISSTGYFICTTPQDCTYHGLCYTSRLAGMRNKLLGNPMITFFTFYDCIGILKPTKCF